MKATYRPTEHQQVIQDLKAKNYILTIEEIKPTDKSINEYNIYNKQVIMPTLGLRIR